MTTPLVIFALLVCGPIALAMLLRVNAAVLFMSLCVGAVLVQYIAGDANSFMSTIVHNGGQVSESTVKLVLLLLPPVLTLIFMFHSVRGLRLVINLLPALGVGLLTALLVKPLLATSFQRTLERATLWSKFSHAQTLVVGVSALLSLLFLWIGRQSGHASHGHHSKQH